MVIASGEEKDAISRILKGEEIGTLFVSRENRLQFRKRWLAFWSEDSRQNLSLTMAALRQYAKAGRSAAVSCQLE